MALCLKILFVCIMMLNPKREACTCLMLDGTQSCLSNYGAWPGANPPPVNCGLKVCDATVPLPTCNKPAPNQWDEAVDQNSWITEFPKFKAPNPGQKGMERKVTAHQDCVETSTCNGCTENLEAVPPGFYCSSSSAPKKHFALHGLCTNAKECDGELP